MAEENTIEVTAEMFRDAMRKAEKTPIKTRVTSLFNGNKEVVLTQTLCDALGQPVKTVEFGFVARGELALLDDDELINVVTQAMSEGLLSGQLELAKVK